MEKLPSPGPSRSIRERDKTAATCTDPPDHCSRTGALLLKARLEAYWRERGYDVNVSISSAGFYPAIRSVSFEIRSDLRDGLPLGFEGQDKTDCQHKF